MTGGVPSNRLLHVLAAWNVILCADTTAWLAARARYLTASDVAAVLGLHPHKSRAKVLAEKRELNTPGVLPKPEPRVDAMRAGHFLEGGVFAWWLDDATYASERLGLGPVEGMLCRNPEGASLLVAHPDESLRLAASPDCLALAPEPHPDPAELVEIKVHGPKAWARWHEPLTQLRWERGRALGVPRAWLVDDTFDGGCPCPLQHWVQLQTQLLCTGVSRGWVVGNCGSERDAQPFQADAAFQARVKQAAREFWADMEEA